MNPAEIIREKREEILALAAKKYGAHHVRVFGSVARIRERVLREAAAI